jgi:aryl-alcohol dehydrogenase-like predicted oxidoreductase
MEAVDGQLQRLGTDFIDILQLQWPDRYLPISGSESYNFKLERNDSVPILDQIKVMDELIKAGKIRHYGVSNETPYGIALWTATADMHGLPRPISTQNTYNLLVRNEFEMGMVEACSPALGNVGLLATSPLAGGALTGKYLDGRLNPNSRLHKYIGFTHRYIAPPSQAAVKEYQDVANYFSLPLNVIALSFVYSRPFVSSTIIGVSSLSQLHDNVLSLNVPFAGELHAAINKVYRRHLDPTKGVFQLDDPFIENIDPSKQPWGAKDYEMDPELDLLISQRMSKF